MKWAIAASFVDKTYLETNHWLERFVPGDRHQFELIPRRKPLPKWHDRKSKFTSFDEWVVYQKQAADALNADADGVITVFPQLASAVGAQQLLKQHKKPVVAWLFNVGTCSSGVRQWLAQMSCKHIDTFVVHTRREIDIYSDWLKLPKERFQFLPYQAPDIETTYEEETAAPFMASLRTAHRDYPTFFEAVKRLDIPTVVATGVNALDGIEVPDQVQTPFKIPKSECLKLAQQARLNVIPLLPKDGVTAAGQVTIVEAMHMGRPLIATRYYGADDYIIHGETGWLVEPNSVESMMEAIDLLWHDHDLRQYLANNARDYAKKHFSDPVAGQNLERVLDQVCQSRASKNFKVETAL
jgi:glycosyltransferase involved in cell wall biosynthesis